MSASINRATASGHRLSVETVKRRMAKVDLNSVETVDFRQEIGRAVARAFALAGVSQKEVAADLGVDVAQVSRWIAGTERAQFDRLFAVEALREPLVVALAALAEYEVETRLTKRRVG